jgi:hypothetical protein
VRRIASAMGVGSSAGPSSVARYRVGGDMTGRRTDGRGGNGVVGRVAEKRSSIFFLVIAPHVPCFSGQLGFPP